MELPFVLNQGTGGGIGGLANGGDVAGIGISPPLEDRRAGVDIPVAGPAVSQGGAAASAGITAALRQALASPSRPPAPNET